jgi:hypothetical protein
VSVAGVVVMCAAAYVATWFKGGGSAGQGTGRTPSVEAVP